MSDWWPRADDRPLVYATFGSVAAGIGLFPAFYARVVEQLADVPARVLLTVGEPGDPCRPRNVATSRARRALVTAA